MQLEFGRDKLKCLRIFPLALKEEKNWQGKKRSEEKFKVRSKRVSPEVNSQVSGSEQLKIVAESWVFISRLVT